MSDDRVVVHTLEMATSTDQMAIQTMQARRLNEQTAAEYAQHAIPVPNVTGVSTFFAAASVDHRQALVTGLNVYYDSPTTCIVSPGSLTQPDASWLAATDPVSAARTGYLRAATTLTYPASASGVVDYSVQAWHLLLARVVEVVSATAATKIFNATTQQFETSSQDKRVETRIEFKWVSGQFTDNYTMAFPALTSGGTGWEPIAFVSAATGGTATNNCCRVLDVARRAGGVLHEFQSNAYVTTNTIMVGGYASQRLSSAVSPDCGPGTFGGLCGQLLGSHDSERSMFLSSPDGRNRLEYEAIDGNPFSGEAALVHYYLCPFVSGAYERWPLQTVVNAAPLTYIRGVKRGLLVASETQPNRVRSNSATMTLNEAVGYRGKYTNMDPISRGRAQYLCSAHYQASNSRLYPFVMGPSGAVTYGLGEFGGVAGASDALSPTILSISSATGLTGLNRAWTLDLTGKVPDIATVVYLVIAPSIADSFPMHHWEIRNYVDSTSNQTANAPAVIASPNCGIRIAAGETINAEGAQASTEIPSSLFLRVPVGWVPATGHNDASSVTYHLKLILREWSSKSGTGLAVSAAQVRLVGWEI